MSNDDSKPLVEGNLVVTDLLGLGAATKNLTPAAAEIVKAIARGAGKVFEPASIYLNSRAQNAADRQNALADAKAYLQLQTRSPAVLEAMKERILHTEYRRQENISAAQAEALQIAQSAKIERPASEISPDFMAEWTDGVKDVSSKGLQHMWAQILASAPAQASGRIEKAVVDFLKLLDADTALELKSVYERSFYTTGMLPMIMARVSAVSVEVGLGRFVDVHEVSTLDDFVQFNSEEVPFHVFELSARARRVGELLFGDPGPALQTENMALNINDWIGALGISTSGSFTFQIRVRTSFKTTTVFAVHAFGGGIVRGGLGDIRTPDKVRDLPLPDQPYFEVFRAALKRLSDENSLIYVAEESFVAESDWPPMPGTPR